MARSVLSNPASGMLRSIVGRSWWIVAQKGPHRGTFGIAFVAVLGTLAGMSELSTTRAVTLYVGALLGPGVLLVPGLAAEIAGPASIVSWLGLLGVSGLLAVVFSALGRRYPGRSGAAGFAGAAFGPRAERAVAACFLVGAVLGAPVVCLIGAAYVTQVVGGGLRVTVALAAVLLLAVVALTTSAGQASGAVQLGLVGLLTAVILVAVVGALPSARIDNWTPFAPHGWSAIGTAGTVLMLSFVGWEAIAPMTARLRDAERQLPRVIALAFSITSAIYLALAVAVVGTLGARAGSATPVADLLRIAIGPVGAVVAAIAAVALTLAATNAYLCGAAELAAELVGPRGRRAPAARRRGRRGRAAGAGRGGLGEHRAARRAADDVVRRGLRRRHRRGRAPPVRLRPARRGALLRSGRRRARLRRDGRGAPGPRRRRRRMGTRRRSSRAHRIS